VVMSRGSEDSDANMEALPDMAYLRGAIPAVTGKM